MKQVEYKGRKLQILEEDGFHVEIYRDGQRTGSTAKHFEHRDDAIAAAKKLIDDAERGHSCA